MKKTSILLLIVCLVIPQLGRQNPQKDAVDVINYRFRIELNDSNNRIEGTATLKVTFIKEGVQTLILNLIGKTSNDSSTGMTVDTVTRNQKPLLFTHSDDKVRIEIGRAPVKGDTRVYTITYGGTPADGLVIGKNSADQRTFFADNYPNRARHWLPTVDHPSDKAGCEFLVIAPSHYQVVANGLLREETDLDGGKRLSHWVEELPLPTKVMVIGVARFAVDHLPEYKGVDLQSWVFPKDREKGFKDFSRTADILAFFEERIGPFPYAKLANVQSKTRWGGMENAGAIFYNERSLQGDRNNEGLMVHEIAHQWFGDAVTEAGWEEVWLSEGFATYLTAVYREKTQGAAVFRQSMERSRQRVVAYSKKKPNSPLVHPSPPDPREILNTNSYQKGSWVLHMLRKKIGDRTFWEGMQRFFTIFRHKTARTSDFRTVMEVASVRDLSQFFQQWALSPGQPKIKGSWSFRARKKTITIRLSQQTGKTLFDFPLEVGIYQGSGKIPELHTFKIDKKRHTFTIPRSSAPEKVVLDPDIWTLMEYTFKKG